jgi:AraC-like DNA-binding protein
MPAVDQRRVHFWRPDVPSIAGMLRVENEDRLKTTYSEHFVVVAVYAGAFDAWSGGRRHTLVAGATKLKDPGEVHRTLRVRKPYTLQGVAFLPEVVTEAAAALGLRGPAHFKAPGFAPGARASRLAFAMHAALVRPDAPALERSTRVAETLGALLSDDLEERRKRAPRAVRLARAFLHDGLAGKITLDALAVHAGLDKFHLVRAFTAEVGLPPYEYLTRVRIARARKLLEHGVRVADAAQAVGLYDESQLHRHFRRILGITPGRYARSFRGGAPSRQHRPSGTPATVAQ